MVIERGQRVFVALLLVLATCGCDSNTTAPTKAALTYESSSTSAGVTFVGSSGLSMTCAVENPAAPSQGAYPIPVLGNPVPTLGNPVPLLMNPRQPAAAMAILSPPSISLNLAFLQPLVVPVQAFVFFRECGRFNVAQAGGPASTIGANCWSAGRLRRMNLFGPSEQLAIQRFLEQAFPVATASAPSGAEQWRMMGSCVAPSVARFVTASIALRS